ncbi:MAG: serine protease [Rhodobacteraceae bacterium]|nr:serine protease [Paracoccaceae bacterium]MAY44650.1 serine protease [Paracoccaceae bacterium]
MLNPLIFSRAFNTPLLMHQAKARAFVAGFGPRLTGMAPVLDGFDAEVPASAYRTVKPFASILDGSVGEQMERSGRGYAVRDGVAVVPVTGALIHRGSWVGQSSGQTSYEGIAAQVEAAARDTRVRGIVLEIDSFGGEAAGAFSLAKTIREIRGEKQILAIVAENAMSAAYAIASQADRIAVPPSGSCGSIGVIMMHVDMSEAMEAAGFRVTLIEAGAHKGEGNPYQALPEDVREKFKAEAETLRQIFCGEVGAGRGDRLSSDAALATEAETYLGETAVEVGLADEVIHPKDAFAAFVADLGPAGAAGTSRARSDSRKENPMTTKTDNPAADASEDVVAPDADGAQPTPEATNDTAPAPQADAPDARKRIAGIFDHPEAKGRDGLARHLALETDMSVEAAGAVMAAAAKAQPGLAAKMAGENTDLAVPQGDAANPGPSMADRVRAKFAS